MKFRNLSILRAPADDDATGGGNGNGAPKQLTEEDIGRIANQAITAQLKRLNIDEKIGAAIKSLDIDGKFGEIKTLLATEKQPPGEKQKPGEGVSELPPEIAKQFKELAEQVEKSEARYAAEKQAREESERKHQADMARQKLYESLKPHADSNLHDVWVEHLVHNNRLKIEDGAPLLEVEYSAVKGMPKQKEFLPLEEALPHLVSSPDSKRFMAVSDPGAGNGSRAPRGKHVGGDIKSNNPADRVRARLQRHGLDADAEFGG